MTVDRSFTTTQQRVMRQFQRESMRDRAILQRRVLGVMGTTGQPNITYEDVETTVCGFEFSPFKFRSRELVIGTETGEIFVRVRIPYPQYTQITPEWRIVLIERLGETLAEPETYDVRGFNEVGVSAAIVNLQRAEI